MQHARSDGHPPSTDAGTGPDTEPVDLLRVSRELEVARVDRIEFSHSRVGHAMRVALATFGGVGVALIAGFVITAIVEHEAVERAVGIMLLVVAVGAVAWAVIFEFFPSRRLDLRVAEVVIRFLLRCVGLLAATSSFIVVSLLVVTRASLPESWSADQEDLMFSVSAIAVAGTALAFLARTRAPFIPVETRCALLGPMVRPRTVAGVAVLALALTVLVPILPGPDGEEAAQAAAVVSALATVAAMILAAGFAWLSVSVMSVQYNLTAARLLSDELLDVAGAARRARHAALTEAALAAAAVPDVGVTLDPASAPRSEATAASDELFDTLSRVVMAAKHRSVRRRATPAFADRGVHLALEGVLERLAHVPLGPVASRYERSIRRSLGSTDDTGLFIGIEAFVRELAARARAGEASTPAQFARALSALTVVAGDEARTAAAAARRAAPSGSSPGDLGGSPPA